VAYLLKPLSRLASRTMVNQYAHEAMRRLLITTSSIWLVLDAPVSAQTIPDAQMRATILARMRAGEINGSVKRNSTADCMHQAGGESSLARNTAMDFIFRFNGGPTDWADRRNRPTLETVILVTPDGKSAKVM
jgi:hypothetical protein